MARHNVASAADGGRALNGRAVVVGLVVTLVTVLIISLIMSLLIYVTEMSEGTVAGAIYYLGMVCVALGGAISGRRARRLGWLHGGLVGLLYAAGSLALTFVIAPGPMIIGEVLGRIGAVSLVGILGGIIGVNL